MRRVRRTIGMKEVGHSWRRSRPQRTRTKPTSTLSKAKAKARARKEKGKAKTGKAKEKETRGARAGTAKSRQMERPAVATTVGNTAILAKIVPGGINGRG